MPSPVILIVDDQPDSADLLSMLLETVFPEAALHVAYGGKEGLSTALKQPPDVAILDIEMPYMDGVELAAELRKSFPQEAPLLIALSGNLARLTSLQHKTPFDHQMSKPLDFDALVGLLAYRL